MRRISLLLVAVLSAALPVVASSAPAGASAPPTYYPSGPQANVDERALVGWRQCWSGTYVDTPALADVLAACDGDYLLLASGPVASPVFDVVAAGPRADVLFDTGTGNTPHDANGVGWYYDESSSWGFAKAGELIVRNPCDIVGSSIWSAPNGDLRLCWHTLDGSLDVGWRSGVHDFLNESTDYRRAIYVEAPDSTPPTITAAVSAGTAGNDGWYTSAVTVSFTCADEAGGSGIPAGACPASQTLSGEGAGIASTPETVTDTAGNESSPSNVVTVSIDTSPPSVSPVVPSPVYLHSAATVLPGATDGVSGVDTAGCTAVDTATLGAQSVTCSATDRAGNTASQTVSVEVVARVPAVAQDCRNAGWRVLVDSAGRPFRNQGDCVSSLATKGKNPANG